VKTWWEKFSQKLTIRLVTWWVFRLLFLNFNFLCSSLWDLSRENCGKLVGFGKQNYFLRLPNSPAYSDFRT
jgi:hypothetical protein